MYLIKGKNKVTLKINSSLNRDFDRFRNAAECDISNFFFGKSRFKPS